LRKKAVPSKIGLSRERQQRARIIEQHHRLGDRNLQNTIQSRLKNEIVEVEWLDS